MKHLLMLALCLLPLACKSAAPSYQKIKFGISNEQEVRAQFSRGCTVTKVIHPDGTFELHVFVRSVDDYCCLQFDHNGILQSIRGASTR